MSESEPFYMPSPSLFGHADAYRQYTTYATRLQEAGFAHRFPEEADVRHIAIELLAERYAVEDIPDMPYVITEAIEEARDILEERRQRRSEQAVVLVYAVVSAEMEKAVELFVRREDAERFLEEVEQYDAELAEKLRLAPVELDA